MSDQQYPDSIPHLLRRLWQHIKPQRRFQLIFLLLLMVLVSFAEIISIGSVFSFLWVLTEPERIFHHDLAQPFLRWFHLSAANQLLVPLAGYCHSIYTLSPKPFPAILEMPEGSIFRSRMKISVASCDIGGFDSFRKYGEQASRAEVLVYHFPWPFADFLRLFSKRAKPAILVYHSDIVRQRWLEILYRPLMWWMLKSMKFIISTSPEYAVSSPILSHPSLRNKVRVIPLGIDEKMYPKEADANILSRLGIRKDEPYFLFVGMLRQYKGLEFLIRAAKGLDAKVVIAGSGSQENKLKKLAEDLSLDNLIFAGSVSDAEKVSLMKYARALVLPSHLRSEAYGMVLVEASMFGKPMISCGIGTGTSYVNQHEVTGFVVPPSSPTALTAAMRKLLIDENLSKSMGHEARRRYEALFSGPALGLAYAGLLEEVISTHDAE